tara:strand:- start:160 stop:1008 length:849 start_codon:yes stop_codon:yes gene_type:complete
MLKLIVVTTKDHMYSNMIIRKLMTLSTVQIVGIVEGVSAINNKTPLQALYYYYRVSGLMYVWIQITKMLAFLTLRKACSILNLRKSIYYPFQKEKDERCAIIRTKNINAGSVIDKINKLKPDIILSLFTGLIFKVDVLALPKNGCINLHPSMLPAYKGVSPVFWSMLNNDRRNGATLHHMTDSIDSGLIISQKKARTPEIITEHSLYMETVSVSFDILNKYFMGKLATEHETEIKAGTISSYCSFPTKKAVKLFTLKKKKFCYFKEIIFPKYTFDSLFGEKI